MEKPARAGSLRFGGGFRSMKRAGGAMDWITDSDGVSGCLGPGKRYSFPVKEDISIRLASEDDIQELERLIQLSVRELMAVCYSSAQLDAALGPVFGVDGHLIRDGTYFVALHGAAIAGCGG